MLIPHKGHTDTIQVYSVTVMTHVKALQAGHSSQGTSEPITPVSKLTSYYTGIMQDNTPLTADQQDISNEVQTKYNNMKHLVLSYKIKPDDIDLNIKKLKRNSSPGIDGITAEYLMGGGAGVNHVKRDWLAIFNVNCDLYLFFCVKRDWGCLRET